MSSAYMNPEIDSDSYGSPMDQAYREHQAQQTENNNTLNSASGKAYQASGGGNLKQYRYITHPKTNLKYNIYTHKGKYILRKYYKTIL